MDKIKAYYILTKPGIIYGNAVNAAAGFFLASKFHSSIFLFLAMLLGISFSIAAACVFNNFIDRDVDSKMERTKKRAFVTKSISPKKGLIFGIILALIGASFLIFGTNLLTSFITFIGFVFYIILYAIGKRKSVHGTLVGAVSGAVPPVVGYTAVTNNFDTGALLLFLILVAWQMPHFYAIAIYRLKDYKSAGIPVLPAKYGLLNTKIQMIFYILLFLVSTSLLTFFRYTGFTYLVVVFALSIYWLILGIQGFFVNDSDKWARKMFFFSLIITLVFAFIVSVGGILP
ncbi:MAG TPA: heme o synthase [Patescibacteria group bacterium]